MKNARDRNAAIARIDQIAMVNAQLWRGSELGGDPSGCPGMIAAVSPHFRAASAGEAAITCRRLAMQYLVADIYDPIWKSPDGWAWGPCRSFQIPIFVYSTVAEPREPKR
jgi:hypothetical protein